MRLPNAPLLEVIFELRWQVQISATGRPPLGYDPAFHEFEPAFRSKMAARGYARQEALVAPGPVVVYSPVRRFRINEHSPFPLYQIGHGIYSCNVSTEYEWTNFRELALSGLRDVVETYPKTRVSKFTPTHIELRYLNIFNRDFLKHRSFERFLMESTKVQYGGLPFLRTKQFGEEAEGALKVRNNLANKSLGWFQFDVTTGSAGEEKGILTTSRVVKEIDAADMDWSKNTARSATRWIDDAHEVASDFFKSFISDDLMKSYKSRKQVTK